MIKERPAHTPTTPEDTTSLHVPRRRVLIGGAATAVGLLAGCTREKGAPAHSATSTKVETSSRLLEAVVIPDSMKTEARTALTRSYQQEKGKHLRTTSDGSLRALFNPDTNDTALEVQTWWELAALAQGDTDTFKKLTTYDKKYQKENGMYHWHINADGKVNPEDGEGAPSDVMIDLALARLLSPDVKVQDYGKTLVADMADALIDPQTNLLKAGDYQNGPLTFTNPAYFDPFAFELFGEIDPRWKKTATACRGLMDKIAEKIDSGKLKYFPQWVNQNGDPVNGPGGANDVADYDYDTLPRVPIRQLRAALYAKDPEVKKHALGQLTRANAFFEGRISDGKGNYNIDMLVDGYDLQGNLTGQNTRTAVAAGAAVAALVSPDEGYRNYMFEQLKTLPNDYPFNADIRRLALLTIGGSEHIPAMS